MFGKKANFHEGLVSNLKFFLPPTTGAPSGPPTYHGALPFGAISNGTYI